MRNRIDSSELPRRPSIKIPKQARAIKTRERLLDIAGELLEEVGLEDISTNMICARAGLSPPTLYRYFEDKHAVLQALGMRLMERQNERLLGWFERHVPLGFQSMLDNVEGILRETAEVTASEPGGAWIARVLHASPRLAHIRVESHRFVTDAQMEVFDGLVPDISREELWQRIRLMIEFGYAALEMMAEEDRIPSDRVFAETARVMRFTLLGKED
ncbi:MAG: TetR/AcrR family transcriptional regulator [Sphingopyxis sp.]|nr:TetR/AcrR family transcriptional regulator [Sphingopyxis sp.]